LPVIRVGIFNFMLVYQVFENMANFTYLETTVTGQNYVHEEIHSRFLARNATYYSVQNLFYLLVSFYILRYSRKINYNFVCCVCVSNWVCHISRTQVDGI
jgi:hypothetical protein